MDIEKNIDEFSKKELSRVNGSTPPQSPAEEPQQAEAVDYYYERQKARREASKRAKTNGAPATMRADAEKIIEQVQPSYNVTKNQFDHLVEYGMPDKAQYMAEDYMEKNLLPAIESLTAAYGPDAVLSNKDVLSMFDELVVSKNGSGDGYTATFIKSLDADERGQRESESDAEVVSTIQKIRGLNKRRDIRGAVGLADKLKKRIDAGELSADDESYAFLAQAVNR